MEKDKILSVIKVLKEEVSEKYKTEVKGIFGSYVRGDQKEESDIDVLVEFLEGADLFDFVGLGLFLEERLNPKVDVVPEEDIREELREQILKEAIYI